MLIPTTALFLGILHAFGPDHLAAVSTFLSHRRGPSGALGVSLEWGIAHMMGVLVPGVIFAAFLGSVPDRFSAYAELIVGVVLVYVGLLALRRNYFSRNAHRHGSATGTVVHAHLHTSDHRRNRYGRRVVGLTGVVHGLAGAVPALALVPVSGAGSALELSASLFMFGLGVILAMAAYCMVLGGMLQRVREAHLLRLVQPALGGFSCLLGLVWMLRTGLIV
ncbi:MAG: hypothetical protein GEV06_14875 [Luteitalea sp.]|nr:hypothetical protein [Luteitalea sp.]